VGILELAEVQGEVQGEKVGPIKQNAWKREYRQLEGVAIGNWVVMATTAHIVLETVVVVLEVDCLLKVAEEEPRAESAVQLAET
jgi:uncharacterized membrane protein